MLLTLFASTHAYHANNLPVWSESPTCPFQCLALSSNGAQLSQIGNCGCDCTLGIELAKDGAVYPEVYTYHVHRSTHYIE